MADRTASTVWQGDLFSGSGAATLESSGLASDLPVSWPARTEEPGGQTSPEELIAAAHSSCFSMALSKQLADRDIVADRIEASATVSFVAGQGVTASALTVQVSAADLDDATLQEVANAAKDGCPVSQALKGNVELSVTATLA
ncbi:MAG: OsmC family peroxiredoxin [Nitriliruptoraceae bacterium]